MWLAVEWGVVLAHYGENGWGQGEGRRGGGSINIMHEHSLFLSSNRRVSVQEESKNQNPQKRPGLKKTNDYDYFSQLQTHWQQFSPTEYLRSPGTNAEQFGQSYILMDKVLFFDWYSGYRNRVTDQC